MRPADRPRRGLSIDRSVSRQPATSGHSSLLAAGLLAPFALRPAFPAPVAGRHARDYYEASAPPGTHSWQRACPLPRWPHERRAIPDGSHVHHATDRRGRRPTLPQRHRHDYAVGIHRGLPPRGISPSKEFPTGTTPFGTRRNPAHIRQIGAGGSIEGLYTLVSHVRLSVLLAEPAPSGSSSTSRRCQDCLPPFPAFPGSGCPQLHPVATTTGRRGSSTPARSHSATWRTIPSTHRYT
jgi:hypothetical protein